MSDAEEIDTLVASGDTEFPALFQLFGGYFHEDWRSEYADPDVAVAAYRMEAPADAVREAVAELDRIFAARLPEPALSRLLSDGFGCSYVPARDETTNADWLASVREGLAGHKG